MAIALITTINRYEGVSTDAKPMDAVTEGSQLHELDTGKRFIMMDGNWKEDISGPVSDTAFNTVQATSRRLTEDQINVDSFDLDRGHYNFIENR